MFDKVQRRIEEVVLKQIETILHNDELLDKVADEILKLQKKENTTLPMLTKGMIIEWFGELKKYGVKRKDHKRRLIDLFLNSVHLFEDRLVINFNYKDGTEAVLVVEVENLPLSSDSTTVAAPNNINPNF